MSVKEIKIIEGEVKVDIFGRWDDCDPGLYLGCDKIETIFRNYLRKRLKVTIEVIDSKENGGE